MVDPMCNMSDINVMDGARTKHGPKRTPFKADGKHIMPINLTKLREKGIHLPDPKALFLLLLYLPIKLNVIPLFMHVSFNYYINNMSRICYKF